MSETFHKYQALIYKILIYGCSTCLCFLVSVQVFAGFFWGEPDESCNVSLKVPCYTRDAVVPGRYKYNSKTNTCVQARYQRSCYKEGGYKTRSACNTNCKVDNNSCEIKLKTPCYTRDADRLGKYSYNSKTKTCSQARYRYSCYVSGGYKTLSDCNKSCANSDSTSCSAPGQYLDPDSKKCISLTASIGDRCQQVTGPLIVGKVYCKPGLVCNKRNKCIKYRPCRGRPPGRD